MELILRNCCLNVSEMNILLNYIYLNERYELLQYVEIENIYNFLNNLLNSIGEFFPETFYYIINNYEPFEYLIKINEIRKAFREWYADIDNKNYNYDMFCNMFYCDMYNSTKTNITKYLDFLDNNYPNIFFKTVEKYCLYNPGKILRYLLKKNIGYHDYIKQYLFQLDEGFIVISFEEYCCLSINERIKYLLRMCCIALSIDRKKTV